MPDDRTESKVTADVGKTCTIREQIIEDPASGLTVQFEVDGQGCTRCRLFGRSLPFGNREIVFGIDGLQTGTSTLVCGLARPAWTSNISDVAT